MISNKLIIDGLRDAITSAFQSWLNENRSALLEMAAASMASSNLATVPAHKTAPPANPAPKVHFTTAELAQRWNYHRESIRRLVRQGVLPAVRFGPRILIPIAAVEELEKKATVHLQ